MELDLKTANRRFGACAFGLLMTLAIACPARASDCNSFSYLELESSLSDAPEGAVCSQYRTLNASAGVSCYWEFSLRDGQATRFADAMWSEIKTCRNGQTSASDLRVNHPDSYLLREWASDAGTYSVSIKDKIALNRTLVFVRFDKLPD